MELIFFILVDKFFLLSTFHESKQASTTIRVVLIFLIFIFFKFCSQVI